MCCFLRIFKSSSSQVTVGGYSYAAEEKQFAEGISEDFEQTVGNGLC